MEAVHQVGARGIIIEGVAAHAVALQVVGAGDGDGGPEPEAERSAPGGAVGVPLRGEPAGQPHQRQGDEGQRPQARPGPRRRSRGRGGPSPREDEGGRGRHAGERRQGEVGDVAVHAERQGQEEEEDERREGAPRRRLAAPQGDGPGRQERRAPHDDPGHVLAEHVGAGEGAAEGGQPFVDRLHEAAPGQREGEAQERDAVGVEQAGPHEERRQAGQTRRLAQPLARGRGQRRVDRRARRRQPHQGGPQDEPTVQVRPGGLEREEGPERRPGPGAAARQEEQERGGHQVREDVRPFEEARRRQHHHEGEAGEGGGGGGPEPPRRGIQGQRHQRRHAGLEEDEGVEARAARAAARELDQPEQDPGEPFVGDEGAAPRQRRVVVEARHLARGEDHGAGLQVQEEVVVGDRGDVEGEDQQEQGGQGERLVEAARPPGRHRGPYFSRDAIRPLTTLPSTLPRWRAMNSFMARPRSFFSLMPSSARSASTARAVSSGPRACGR